MLSEILTETFLQRQVNFYYLPTVNYNDANTYTAQCLLKSGNMRLEIVLRIDLARFLVSLQASVEESISMAQIVVV